jgi:hypothetical protein
MFKVQLFGMTEHVDAKASKFIQRLMCGAV